MKAYINLTATQFLPSSPRTPQYDPGFCSPARTKSAVCAHALFFCAFQTARALSPVWYAFPSSPLVLQAPALAAPHSSLHYIWFPWGEKPGLVHLVSQTLSTLAGPWQRPEDTCQTGSCGRQLCSPLTTTTKQGHLKLSMIAEWSLVFNSGNYTIIIVVSYHCTYPCILVIQSSCHVLCK